MEEKVDLVVPILGDPGAWRESVEAAVGLSPIPAKLWIYNDGGGAEAEAEIRDFIRKVDRRRVPKIVAFGSGGRIYCSKVFNRVVDRALKESEASYLVFVHPAVIVDSRHWLDTLLHPFVKDKNAATVRALMGGIVANVPWKADPTREKYEDYPLRLQAFRKLAFEKLGVLDSSAPNDLHGSMKSWELRAFAKHSTCWRDNRVNAIEREWKEPALSGDAYSEVVRRSGVEALTFVDS